MNKHISKFIMIFFILIVIFLLFNSCTSILKGLTKSLYSQKDIQLVEEGAPAYLLLVEGFIDTYPKNKDWLMSGIQMFTAYSAAFIKDKERKKIFTDKTKEWGLRLLRTYSGFKKYENSEFNEYEKWIKTLTKKDIPYTFWACDAWIMWILENSDSIDAMIQLPKAKAIVDKIYELDSSYYFGSPHLFYGIYYSALPEIVGGNMKKAKVEFDKALEISQDKLLMTKVSYAEFYLKKIYDKKNYEKILQEVIAVDLDKYPEMRLLNAISQKQAKVMLDEINEFFYNDDFK